jgi:peptide deformylase
MAGLDIAKLGNPVLRKKAEPVSQQDIGTAEFQQFIDDMLATMVEAEGIGLAAPQVSRSQQVVVMDCPGEGGFPQTVLINPKIVFYGPQQVENWEGCLSVDGLRGKVSRPSMIRVQALDRQGEPLDFEASGLFSVCIQHELDHLIGKVFLDRMSELSSLTQLEEFDRFWKQDHATVI